jgi:glycosyltransferase involved in cell wall biosynthesis
MRRPAAWAIRNASAVIGITSDYIDWACDLARRSRGPLDRPVPLTYPVQPPLTSDEVAAGSAFWKARGVDLDRDWVASFLGTVGRQFDFEPVLEAARVLEQKAPDVRFVLCGSGEGLDPLRRQVAGLFSVLTPGWVEGPARRLLLARSRVGLGPYVVSENFRRNLPNKPVEYFAYGLPVVHALEGVLDEVCTRSGAGVRYGGDAGDLADVLLRLHADEGRRSGMAEAAGRLFQQEFRPDAVTDRLLDLCTELVAARRGGAGGAGG